MILSLFIVTGSRNICMEKHWRNVINKSICDYFFDCEDNKSRNDVPPVIRTPHYYLINIFRDSLYYIAVCSFEVPPLFVIEFLHRFVDVIVNYFSAANESIIKDNIVRIYEILDEMIDNGFPLVTESNVLEELVRPPSLLRVFTDTISISNPGDSNLGQSLPKGQLSSVPWRRSGVSYSRNEAFFDVIESISAVIDRSGSISRCEIDGHVECFVKLSGIPDLTLAFSHPNLLDEVSLHPCVRYLRWQRDRVISFIPPDGKFRLMTYHTSLPTHSSLPLLVRGNISNGRIEVTITAKRQITKPIDKICVKVKMPNKVTNVTGSGNVGRCQFDTSNKCFSWNINHLENHIVAVMRGNITSDSTSTNITCTPLLELDFKILQYSASGIRVSKLDVYGESYKPFKGVKYITKAGNFQVST